MISPRPWTLNSSSYRPLFIETADGCAIDVSYPFRDEAHHAVACVNAFHEAGIDPADLPKFIEAVRAWHKYLPTIANKQPGVQEWMDLVHHGNEAAACLPEQ